MYVVPIAWLYVALMMAVAEAQHPQGSVVGAIMTFLFYGVAPVLLILYFMLRRASKRARKAQEAIAPSDQPDAGGETAADSVAAMRKED